MCRVGGPEDDSGKLDSLRCGAALRSPSDTAMRKLGPWFALAAALFVLGAFLAHELWSTREAVGALERRRLSHQANIVATNLGANLDATNRALDALRRELPALLARDGDRKAAIGRLEAMAGSTTGVRTFLVIDAGGTVVLASRAGLVGTDFASSRHLRALRDEHDPEKVSFTPPFTTPLGVYTVGVIKAVVDDQRRYDGAVVAILDPDYVGTLLGSVLYAPDVRATLVHAGGTAAFSAPDPSMLRGTNLLARPDSLFSRYVARGAGVQIAEDRAISSGDVRLAAYRPVGSTTVHPDPSLVAMVSRNVDALYAGWRHDAGVKSELFGAVAVLSILSMLLYRGRQAAAERIRAARDAEREQVQRRIRDSEERLRLATDGAQAGTCYWDMATGTLDWSDLCRAHFALPAGATPSFDHFYSVIHPEDRDRVRRRLDEAVDTRGEFVGEFRVVHADGSEHWLSTAGRIYSGSDGAPLGMGGVTLDITARKSAELSLRDAEEHLKLAVEGARLGTFSWKVGSREVAWSDAALACLGLAPGTSNDFDEMSARVHPDDRARVEAALRRAQATGADFVEEHRVVWPDGSLHWVSAMGRPFRSSTGEVVRLDGVIQDVTERRAAEQKVRDSAEKLALAVEGARLGTWDLDVATGVIDGSEAWHAYVGVPPGRSVTLAEFHAAVHCEDRERVVGARTRAIAECGHYDEEYRIVWPDGSEHWIASIGQCFCSPDGHVCRMKGVVQDITVRKETERRMAEATAVIQAHAREVALLNAQLKKRALDAETATRTREALLRNVSHELRTPLNHVIGGATVLRRRELDPDAERWLARILESANALSSVIGGILDVAALDSGRVELDRVEFSIPTVLGDVRLLTEHLASAKGLDFAAHVDDRLPASVLGDPTRVTQALLNYVDNAIRFTERGSVTVRAVPAETPAADDGGDSVSVRFEVRDTGPGVAPEVRERLFTVFEQADASLTRAHGGLGIGLFNTRKLARLMGGEAGVESEPGRGSTFWFTARFEIAGRG